ncbi:MAG: hypothetical protein ACFFEK_01055 [Candidatus Thorarchaeota archaeon]
MIASERSQNVIVATMLIAAIVSSIFLVGNAQYFGGSYALAGKMEVSIVNTVVSNIDPLNESVYPQIAFTFNLRTDAGTEGNVRLMFIGAQVYLNHDILSYTPFSYTLPQNLQPLYPHYNRNFTLSRSTDTTYDRDTVNEAYNSSTWYWEVTFRYYFITFDVAETITWNFLHFNWTGQTTTIPAI